MRPYDFGYLDHFHGSKESRRGYRCHREHARDTLDDVLSDVDISFSLEASGELAPGGRWASDTGEPVEGYLLKTSNSK